MLSNFYSKLRHIFEKAEKRRFESLIRCVQAFEWNFMPKNAVLFFSIGGRICLHVSEANV